MLKYSLFFPMRSFLFSILLIVSLYQSDLVSAKILKPKPPCPTGHNYIILTSAPLGFVCLWDSYYYNIEYSLIDYKNRLKNGEDVVIILSEIRQSMRDSGTYTPAEGIAFYPIILDRIKDYASTLCRTNNNNPIVTIPATGIYEGDTLTPTCSLSGRERPSQTGSMSMSLSFIGIGGQSIRYTQTGASFIGLQIDKKWTGKHTITCTYTPNTCIAPRINKRVIDVGWTVIPDSKPIKTHSIARIWNEVMLWAIRKDRVRPPVQARNLFHFGAMSYDIWALYHPGNQTYLFDNTVMWVCLRHHAQIPLGNRDADIEWAMSYASYRLIVHRYRESPGYSDTIAAADNLMNQLGYDTKYTKSDISKTITPAALGNSVANCYIRYGLKDGANEGGKTGITWENWSYSNQYYTPINPPLDMTGTGWGNTNIVDWNRWQPISLETFIDQWGTPIAGGAATFIGAEWGNVKPFSLQKYQQTIHERGGNRYITYLDPGLPPQATGSTLALWQWNYALVGLWSAHLDPSDIARIDISPSHLGNTSPLPVTFSGMIDFYDMKNGGTETLGRSINPKTGIPYKNNIVLRGDYTRAISEFWADGPKSETPPGHWFTIFNSVSDKIDQKRWQWTGPIIDNLEWDVKGYYALGGAMHDAAIAAWGIKWAYDGVRPISAIRAMATHGQSSDPTASSYDIMGLPLIPGYIELIGTGETLAGKSGQNIGKVKIRAWKWPKYINDPSIDRAWVDWILAINWWPYQRPSFVTPPFAGYVSGHSTFSRAAAETLITITGDEYFPWWIMETRLPRMSYLIFEQWPNTDITLQWATYRDAADESALSRIWWGIHPPMDDIPGRMLWEQIGKQAVGYANKYFKK